MKSYKGTLKLLVVILIVGFTPNVQCFAQQTSNSLYAQTSEMADGLIQYDADKASILRFYATTGQGEFAGRQQGNSYNSPERRKRLLELIDEYLGKLKKLPFEKWNINGKV